MEPEGENWMPLESNPTVLNEFLEKVGLKLDLFQAHELLSIEEWALEMIPKPVLGILFLYETTPVQTNHKNEEDITLKP